MRTLVTPFIGAPAAGGTVRRFRAMLLAGVAALALSACASNRTSVRSPDYSGLSVAEAQQNVGQLGARFQSNPRDAQAAINYAAALRAVGQNTQAVAVMERALEYHQGNVSIDVAYAKALASDGRFQQALNIVERTIRPDAPDWNALSVKGAILDQMGQNAEARSYYEQAMFVAPQEASLYANMGLSFAMTGELDQAEQQLRHAVGMRGASSQIRQNLALVLGLQGRFDECRAIYQRELPAEQVEANMAYIRALLTQQNRWDVIEESS